MPKIMFIQRFALGFNTNEMKIISMGINIRNALATSIC